jgi:hypothetical protein
MVANKVALQREDVLLSLDLVLFALACEWASAGEAGAVGIPFPAALLGGCRDANVIRVWSRSANDVVPPVVFSRGEEIRGNARRGAAQACSLVPRKKFPFRGSLLQARSVKYPRRELRGGSQ